jgi:outer membrane cobalamin receptor
VLRAGDLMESVPGLVATQHAGEGKANQYFLRGFNLDHGTDLATFVDGVQINMPTHGHGQGYTDLYFLIPELVDSVAYRKGPYYAEEGDFAAAGSVRLRTIRKVERPFGLIEAGAHGYRRALAVGSLDAGGGDLLMAAERGVDDGPWSVAQRLRKTNLSGKYSRGNDANG